MAPSNHLAVVAGIGYYRLSGSRGFRQSVTAILEAIVEAREQGLRALLVDILDVRGFEAPTIVERQGMVRVWADAAQGALRVAMVAPPAFIDADKFGAVVAAGNFGLAGNVFGSESEALAWLDETP